MAMLPTYMQEILHLDDAKIRYKAIEELFGAKYFTKGPL